ncbi:MAG: hypothetical protein KL863_14345 [Rhizobium sp.]|nr:hypothetical protein [Rhizobium sp.]
MNDPKLLISPLSCQYSEDGITIDVQIYKLEDGDGWSLELVDEENNSTVWEELFTTDEDAWREFRSRREGNRPGSLAAGRGKRRIHGALMARGPAPFARVAVGPREM